MSKLRRFTRRNGLSLTIFGLFLLFLSAESVVGSFAYDSDRSIFLRQRGSPESKPVEAPHSQTGKD